MNLYDLLEKGNTNIRGMANLKDKSIFINPYHARTPDDIRGTMGHELSHLGNTSEPEARIISELLKRAFSQFDPMDKVRNPVGFSGERMFPRK
jgi:hypothetical protein